MTFLLAYPKPVVFLLYFYQELDVMGFKLTPLYDLLSINTYNFYKRNKEFERFELKM